MNNIGVLLLREQDKLKEAEEVYYRRSREGRARTLGRDHPDTLQSVSHLGSLLQAQGKLVLAEPFLRRSLSRAMRAVLLSHFEGCERVHGRDLRNTLTSVNNTGLLLDQQGKLREADLEIPSIVALSKDASERWEVITRTLVLRRRLEVFFWRAGW